MRQSLGRTAPCTVPAPCSLGTGEPLLLGFGGEVGKLFAWNPARRGFGFWFLLLSAIGLGIAGLGLLAARDAGEGAISARFGVPIMTMVYWMAFMGISSGIIVGLLNRWIASWGAAALVGAAAVLPTSVWMGIAKLAPTGRYSLPEILLVSTALAVVAGGVYGVLLYRR